MYAIIVKGKIEELCEKPWYVKKHEAEGRSWWVHTEDAKEAQAVSVRGTLYNLPGMDNIEGAEEAVVAEKQAGEYVYDNRENIAKTAKELAETTETVETAICEMDASAEERIAVLEDVICELDMMLASAE